ncbi:YIP1 family protein [archaeon]|nr:YIP1 family protein [archaeon]
MKILLKDSDLFFQSSKEDMKKDFIQVVVLTLVFSLLTTITIFEGLTTVKPAFDFIESFVAIFLSSLIGILIITAVLTEIIFKKISKKTFSKTLFVIGYAATPTFVIGWIPHGVVKLIAIIWSLIFVFNGLQVVMKKPQKDAALLVVVLCIILVALTLVSQNYLISPI